MPKTILVTGGAGFIGSHLCDRLLADGHKVRVLDNLSPQVHGARTGAAGSVTATERTTGVRPSYMSNDVELLVGDVRDPRACRRALLGVDAVVHLAARVGVGQSMYEVADYTATNNLGTATLLEDLIQRPIERLVVASSMSIYGEGAYVDAAGVPRESQPRTLEQLRSHEWEVRDEQGRPLTPVPTKETKAPSIASVYALSKFDQERLCLTLGQAYGIDTVALRLFNVYGPRQALSNPYTGVMAIFSTRFLHQRPPLINEDGLQKRDFVNVQDVVEAFVLALERPNIGGRTFNIGSGTAVNIRQVAEQVGRAVGAPEIQPTITGQYRVGDIRHCFADIEQARQVLGFRPRVTLEQGLKELGNWLAGDGRTTAEDHVEKARHELSSRGLAL